ncbi:DivIVA domain-containing protein [Aeromicrobium sp. Leaf350]|uniref:DivIVA domain-containing protein n=1 Tax=Aeromicrobium sp. Leaf350 TaxID=2876565 RepID=UPI0027154BA1|nr:DivIVA domain-containing protein [Aeromicrobium sp. Leaf350]
MTTPRFTLVRFREGYDADEVDAFVATVEAEIGRARPDPALADRIRSARFKPRRLRPSYDMGEVDQFLDGLQRRAAEGR